MDGCLAVQLSTITPSASPLAPLPGAYISGALPHSDRQFRRLSKLSCTGIISRKPFMAIVFSEFLGV